MSFHHHFKTPTTRNVLFNSEETNEDLLGRLDYCGVPAPWGWNFCRTAGCQRCRKHRAREWIEEAQELFREVSIDQLRWVTVMLRPCATLTDVVDQVKRGKVAWRNIVARLRAANPGADAMRIFGVAEVDWYRTSHVPDLGTCKQQQMEALGYDCKAPEVWFPHFHVLVDVGSCEVELSRALERKWGRHGPQLVHFRNLRSDQTKDEAISRCLEYATKAKHYYKITPFWGHGQMVSWDKSAVVRYYNVLDALGGFSLIRFHLKPKRENVAETSGDYFIDPQPISFGLSENSYPLINNWRT